MPGGAAAAAAAQPGPPASTAADRAFYITRWVIPNPVSYRANVPLADRAGGLAVVEIVHTAKDHTAFREPWQNVVDNIQRAHPGACSTELPAGDS